MGESPIKSTLSQQTRSEPEGDHQQVVSEAGYSEFAGRVWSPEISIVVVRKDNPALSGESRRHSAVGRQQSHTRNGKCVRHHRDLRSGHVSTGVIGELERSGRILLSRNRMGDTGIENTWRQQVTNRTGLRACGNHKTTRYGQAGIGVVLGATMPYRRQGMPRSMGGSISLVIDATVPFSVAIVRQ